MLRTQPGAIENLLGRPHNAVFPVPELLRRHELGHVLVAVVRPVLEYGELAAQLRIVALTRHEAVEQRLHDAAPGSCGLDAAPAIVPVFILELLGCLWHRSAAMDQEGDDDEENGG